MTYATQTWIDYPNTTTPITAARLNHMEAGIAAAGSGGSVPDNIMVTVVENSDGSWPTRPTGLPSSAKVTWIGPDFPPIDSTHAALGDFVSLVNA